MNPLPSVRERILTAATVLFSEKGYDATSTRDIATKAGVDPTSIFRLFDSKENLFSEVIEAIFSVALPYIPKLEEHPDEGIPKFIRLTLEYWNAHPHRQRLLFRAALHPQPKIRKIVKRYMDRFYGPITMLVKERMKQGIYREHEEVLAGPLLLMGFVSNYHLLTEMFGWKEVSGEPIGAPSYVDAAVEVWLRGMLKKER